MNKPSYLLQRQMAMKAWANQVATAASQRPPLRHSGTVTGRATGKSALRAMYDDFAARTKHDHALFRDALYRVQWSPSSARRFFDMTAAGKDHFIDGIEKRGKSEHPHTQKFKRLWDCYYALTVAKRLEGK